jgi:hypothetical protein
MYAFFFRACAPSGHLAYLLRPDPNTDNLAINIETRTGMATLLLKIKTDQWYLAVVGPPPIDASKPLHGTLLNYAHDLQHNQEVIADQAAWSVMGIWPQLITWTRAGPRRLETGTQPAAEDDDSELWVSLIGLAMIHHRMEWRCHTGNKITIKSPSETSKQWKGAHKRLLSHPDHTAGPWHIAAKHVSFR